MVLAASQLRPLRSVSRLELAHTASATLLGLAGCRTKAGMTQIFTPEGLAVPATVIALEDGNIVTQVRRFFLSLPVGTAPGSGFT